MRWAAANPQVVNTVVDMARQQRTARAAAGEGKADLAAQLIATQAQLDQILQNQRAIDDSIRRLHRAVLLLVLLVFACLGVVIALLVR